MVVWCAILLTSSSLVVSGLMVERGDITTVLIQEKDLAEDTGVSLNNTGFLRVTEREIAFNQWESMAKRNPLTLHSEKSYSPTIACTRAGGHCVKKNAKCIGTIDRSGCRGEKSCKCCLPDDVICAPVTIIVTTEGPTVSSSVSWLSVGSDRFVAFNQTMSWTDGRNLCRKHGHDLYQPTDILDVAEYLFNNLDIPQFWIGAQGNGSHQVWLSGEALTREDPWYRDDMYSNVGTDICVYLLTNSKSNFEDAKALGAAYKCTTATLYGILCG